MPIAFLLLILVLGASEAHAQDSAQHTRRPDLFRYTQTGLASVYTDEWDMDNHHYRAIHEFDYYSNTDGINGRLPTRKLRGKPIPEWMRLVERGRISDNIRFEDNLGAGTTHRLYFPKIKTAFFAGYKLRSLNAMNTNRATFNFFYTPDTPTYSKAAEFGNMFYESIVFHEFKLGFIKYKTTGNTRITYGGAIAFLAGVNMQQLDLTGGKFGVIDSNNRYLKYNLLYQRAEVGQPRMGDVNGMGGSADLFISLEFNRRWKLNLGITDLGGFSFDLDPVTYKREDSIVKDLSFLEVLRNNANSNLSTGTMDGLMSSLGITSNADQVLFFNPFTAYGSFSGAFLKEKLVVTAGVIVRNLPGYYAYGYLKTNYFLPKNWVVSNQFGYGGYSRFNWGVEVAHSWKHVDFVIGSSNLVGLLSPRNYYGRSLYMRIGTHF